MLNYSISGCTLHPSQCYNALVRPILEYGCSAWDPYRAYQIEQLEKINKRAARFVTGNYKREHGNTAKNMKTLGWPPLSERRSRQKFTILSKLDPILSTFPVATSSKTLEKQTISLFLLHQRTLTYIPSTQVQSACGTLFPFT